MYIYIYGCRDEAFFQLATLGRVSPEPVNFMRQRNPSKLLDLHHWPRCSRLPWRLVGLELQQNHWGKL